MPNRHRLVVPQHLREQILNEQAYARHFLVKKMTQFMNQYFYWSGMRGEIYKKCADVSRVHQ